MGLEHWKAQAGQDYFWRYKIGLDAAYNVPRLFCAGTRDSVKPVSFIETGIKNQTLFLAALGVLGPLGPEMWRCLVRHHNFSTKAIAKKRI